MSGSLGEAVLDLGADESGLDRDLDKARSNALKKMDKIGSKMRSVGVGMTAAFTLPAIAIGKFTIDAASDLNESINAVETVFGGASETVLEFSEDAAYAAGLAKSEFNQLGAVTGAMLQNLGYDEAQAADETVNLAKRAADMASVFNTDVSDAMGAINAAMRGEGDPIEKYGVKLSDVAVKAKALEMGLMEAGGELTLQAKAQASIALLYEQTDKIAGDFVNTSDEVANATRITQAEFKNAAAGLGQQLLPYVLQAVQYISQLIAKFQGLSPEQQKMILMIGGIVAVAGPLLVIIGSLISAIAAIIPVVGAVAGVLSFPLIAIIAAVAAVIALLAAAWKNNWGDIRGKAQAVIAFLKPLFEKFISGLVNLWQNVLWPAIKKVWAWMKDVLFPFFQALGSFIGTVFSIYLKALAGIWQNVLWPAVKKFIDWMQKNVMPVLEPIAKFIGGRLAKAFGNVTKAIRTVTDWLKRMTDKLKNIKLPDWMTPGSPTPWELGLLGVNDALIKVSNLGLPDLSGSMGRMSTPALARAGGGASGGGLETVVVNYNPFITGNDESQAKRVLRDIVYDLNRERSNQ